MSTKPGKTPRRVNFQKSSDPLQVFCRIRPLQNAYEESCISVLSSTTIQLTPPDGSNPRYFNNKEVQYVFKKIFDTDSDQKQIYMEVAHPLVDNLIHGKNGLLLTYGVTGSGKTYTMNGSPTDGGIMTRCIDVLFNSILPYQPPRHTFKPDKLNGFEILSSDEIKQVRGVKTPGVKKNVECRVKDEEKIEQVDEDNVYSVFVSYVEIYNNSVYDLLEEIPEGGTGDKSKSTPLNNRLIREDSCQNMYVHGANEIEVTTAEEALQVLYKGQARKKMARTLCNKESSRSHSVFMIRLVQAPLDLQGDQVLSDKRCLTVSQLSLVDLAGSERGSRTHVASGQRLREAGNINNSLMTLRTCLEVLRENQQQGTNRSPPFRESKLTHLFKTYFTGEGDVRMIVCVNPSSDDYDENLAVMKFAEMSQEVQISKPLPSRLDFGLTPGRRKFNEDAKKSKDMINLGEKRKDLTVGHCFGFVDSGVVYNFGPPFPKFDSSENFDTRQKELLVYLENRRAKELQLVADVTARVEPFRRALMELESNARVAIAEKDSLKPKLEAAQSKVIEIDNKLTSMNLQLESQVRANEELRRTLEHKEMLVQKLKLQKEHTEEKMKADKTRLSHKFKSKMNQQAEMYEHKLRHTEKKVMTQVRDLLESQIPDSCSSSTCSSESMVTPRKLVIPYSTSSSGDSSRRKGFEPGSPAGKKVDLTATASLAGAAHNTSTVRTQTSVANRSNVARSEMMKSTNVAKPSELVTNLTKTCDMLKSPHLTNPSAMKSPRSRANSCDGDSGYGDKGKHPGVSTIRRQYMMGVVNPRRRRSRSAGTGKEWLHHHPPLPLHADTVFQPTGWKKRKSVTQLTQVKDIVDTKLTKYSLMTQEQNAEGELQTHLFKADVLPTVGGGAQVVFNDVETLTQSSPTHSPVKKRVADINARQHDNDVRQRDINAKTPCDINARQHDINARRDINGRQRDIDAKKPCDGDVRCHDLENIENRCNVSIEGHSYRQRKK